LVYLNRIYYRNDICDVYINQMYECPSSISDTFRFTKLEGHFSHLTFHMVSFVETKFYQTEYSTSSESKAMKKPRIVRNMTEFAVRTKPQAPPSITVV